MGKENFGDVAIEVMREKGWDRVGFNEFPRLDEIWSKALGKGVVDPIGSHGGRKNPHPINNQERAMNYLDRDERFEKHFIRCCDRSGKGDGLKREFELKEDSE